MSYLNNIWMAVTLLGSDLVFIAVLALYGWLVRPSGIRALGTAFALSYLVNALLKYGLNLPRPFTHDPSIASDAAKATAGGPGLPSGHAQMSTALWGGIAAQVRRPPVWAVCLLLIGLISVSRLALHVHFPSDVLVGLLLGALFAGLAGASASGRELFQNKIVLPLTLLVVACLLLVSLPEGYGRGLGMLTGFLAIFVSRELLTHNIWLPLALLVIACFLPTDLPEEYSRGLGMLAGFWFAVPRYLPPSTWAGRMIVAIVGLIIVLTVYLALGAASGLLPEVLSGPARAIRYFVLVWVAITGVPALLKNWLRPT